MAEERVRRRLAAILAADVVGYSRLIRLDEEGTLNALRHLRTSIIEPKIAEYEGRIVKLMGDGMLAEFQSTVDAVHAAADVQRAIAGSNAGRPVEQRIEIRIGINLGDVVIDGDDIQGDGVNVAARLEAMADPGGVFVSGDVYRQVRGKLDVAFDDLGEREAKNIAEPIRVYALQLEPGDTVASDDSIANEKSSIAVLPFDNLSGDAEQDFIGDGLTEDIITGLSRIRSFFVIARNSTFQYKGTSPDIRVVAKKLGVRYVVEGSTRRTGNRIRISAQLIDGASGNHVWAERYDREFEDLLDVQDEITRTIVAQLGPELGRAEYERVKLRNPENLDAWELFHRGMALEQRVTKEAVLSARQLFQQAIERDPELACAYAGVAWTYAQASLIFGDHEPKRAFRAARRAVELDNKDPFTHLALGRAHYMEGQTESAIDEFEDAIRINPSYAYAHIFLGSSLTVSGRAEEAIPHVELALRLSPADPNIGPFRSRMAHAYLQLGQYENAVLWARKAIQGGGAWPCRAHLLSALGHLGRNEQAGAAREDLERVAPGITIGFVRNHLPISDTDYMDHHLDGLRKAGLPE